jgi:hypothetical protein
VEFEDAASKSIFVSKSGKNTPEWSSRFEKGFTQILDWFWKLDDLEKTDAFEDRFTARNIRPLAQLFLWYDRRFQVLCIFGVLCDRKFNHSRVTLTFI